MDNVGNGIRVTSRSVRTGFLIAVKCGADRCVAAWCASTSASKCAPGAHLGLILRGCSGSKVRGGFRRTYKQSKNCCICCAVLRETTGYWRSGLIEEGNRKTLSVQLARLGRQGNHIRQAAISARRLTGGPCGLNAIALRWGSSIWCCSLLDNRCWR